MDAIAQVLEELQRVRGLLLIANRPSMLECESRLSNLAARTGQLGLCHGSNEVKTVLDNIRFLLNKARDFWKLRGPSSSQLQYTHGGMLAGPIEKFTFTLEI